MSGSLEALKGEEMGREVGGDETSKRNGERKRKGKAKDRVSLKANRVMRKGIFSLT